MSNCNKCYKKACQCGQLDTDFVKQLAAPTFTEDLYKFATENGLFEGSIGEFLIFMKGPQGDNIYEWSVKNGFTNLSKEDWYNEVFGASIDFLSFSSVEEMRNMSDKNILGLKSGKYKYVQLNGYYKVNDTPAPIQYYLSDTAEEDDGGSVFEVGGIKLEHEFLGNVDASYYGIISGIDEYLGLNNTNAFQKIANRFDYNKLNVIINNEGTYMMDNAVIFNPNGGEMEGRVSIVGKEGVIFKKTSTFPTDQYLFQFRKINDVSISNLSLEGRAVNEQEADWGDHGLGLLSVKNARISNCNFRNFGDGAIKVSSTFVNNTPTSSESSTIIASGNFFYNCYQTSTTPGGSANYIFSDNILEKSKIKFASRYPNANNLIIKSNIIKDVNVGDSIEISGYSNFIVEDNVIENSTGVNIYPNPNAISFIEVKNSIISNNEFINCSRGLRVANAIYNASEINYRVYRNIIIQGNIFENSVIESTNASLTIADGIFNSVKIIDNTFDNGIFITIHSNVLQPDNGDNIIISNNTSIAKERPCLQIINQNNLIRLKNIKVLDNTFIGSIGIEYVNNLNFSGNNLHFDDVTNVISNSIGFFDNAIFSDNIITIKDVNGFNLYDASNLILKSNIITGGATSPNYALRLAGSIGVVLDSDNIIEGSVIRLHSNIISNLYGSVLPNDNIASNVGSLYRHTSGKLWYKLMGSGKTGWYMQNSIILSNELTIDVPNVPANSRIEITPSRTVNGSNVGDLVKLYAPNINGIIFQGEVTEVNKVTLYAINYTNTDINPPEGKFKIMVLKQ